MANVYLLDPGCSPPVSNLLLTIQKATRLEKVGGWGAVFRMQWTELGGLVRGPEARFRGQVDMVRRQSGAAESNLEKV